MKLPRQLSGDELASALRVLGYTLTRQTGGHLRLTYKGTLTHHVTIPCHNPLRIGTLSAIITEVAAFHSLSRDELLVLLFGKR
jgi:predicted RNA binding protein YcfA (HicA-like mRNA interferase family)